MISLQTDNPSYFVTSFVFYFYLLNFIFNYNSYNRTYHLLDLSESFFLYIDLHFYWFAVLPPRYSEINSFNLNLTLWVSDITILQYFQPICPIEKLGFLLYSFLDLPPHSKMLLKICSIFPTSIPLVLRPI